MANQHVLHRPDNQWGVRGEGNGKDTSLHNSQQEAFDAARKIAQHQGGDVLVHRRDNRIGWRNTYGKPDPFPPKG